MNNDVITLHKIDGIYDIVPLAIPVFSTVEIFVLSIFITSMAIISLYFAWCFLFSRRAISKRKIKKLEIKYNSDKINAHDTVYELCHILRYGLKLQDINNKGYLSNKSIANKIKWKGFIKRLSDIRYKNNNNHHDQIIVLFEESIYWLKR